MRPKNTTKLPEQSTPLVYSSITQQDSPKPLPEQATRIDIYNTSARIIRPKSNHTGNKIAPDRTGTQLQGFSQKSKANLKFLAANSTQIIKSQFCMTYGNHWPTDGKALKAHLNAFLTDARRKFEDLSYIWIAEFQTRGVPHFHLFTNLDVTPENHATLSTIWHRIAGYDQEEHAKFHAHPSNFIEWNLGTGAYLCKYLDKEHQKIIPDGYTNFGRWWGNSKDLKPRIIDEISPDEMRLFSRDPKAWEKLIRTIGKYHEHINHKSRVRKAGTSRLILTGANVTTQMYRHLMEAKCTSSNVWNVNSSSRHTKNSSTSTTRQQISTLKPVTDVGKECSSKTDILKSNGKEVR